MPERNLVDQKFSETDQKFPETGQFFLWSTKKMRKRPNNWSTKRLTKTTWTGLLGKESDRLQKLYIGLPKRFHLPHKYFQ